MPELFTLGEVRALLLTLARLLTAARERKANLSRRETELRQLVEGAAGDGHGLAGRVAAKRREAEVALEELRQAVARIHQLGCELKDLERGLVDFRSERDGRIVYLCWQLGEEDIAWWHELEAGFAGRQPL